MITTDNETIKQFSNELTDNILNYWIRKVYDPQRQTFFGLIDANENAHPDAPQGVVMMTRILWTFSAAYKELPNAVYQKMADEAFRILTHHFWDDENGGVFWEVTPDGKPTNTSKQFYAQAFAIYAFAEYSRTFNNKEARQLAVTLFHLLEKYAFDPKNGGYLEASAANWKDPAPDFITPPGKDVRKSMNTHLHVLEAYTNLYRICHQEDVREKIVHVLDLFTKHIINPQNHHFHMFFDMEWNAKTTAISYGHDIEGSWLLWEAAEVIHDEKIMAELRPLVIKMAEAVGRKALDPKGGLYNESDGDHWDKEFHWWPQAEAVVGFYNAWQLTGDVRFKTWSDQAWSFIRQYVVDSKNGEWFGLLNPDYTVRPMAKVSPWKCPYHNGRMCLEMMRRTEL